MAKSNTGKIILLGATIGIAGVLLGRSVFAQEPTPTECPDCNVNCPENIPCPDCPNIPDFPVIPECPDCNVTCSDTELCPDCSLICDTEPCPDCNVNCPENVPCPDIPECPDYNVTCPTIPDFPIIPDCPDCNLACSELEPCPTCPSCPDFPAIPDCPDCNVNCPDIGDCPDCNLICPDTEPCPSCPSIPECPDCSLICDTEPCPDCNVTCGDGGIGTDPSDIVVGNGTEIAGTTILWTVNTGKILIVTDIQMSASASSAASGSGGSGSTGFGEIRLNGLYPIPFFIRDSSNASAGMNASFGWGNASASASGVSQHIPLQTPYILEAGETITCRISGSASVSFVGIERDA